MFKTGLVSISFRRLDAKTIADAAHTAKLDFIEWGADVHAPFKDTAQIHEIAELTRALGTRMLTYGSYYRIGVSAIDEFQSILVAAREIGARVVRVWGYNRHVSRSDDEWCSLVSEAQKICRMAGEYGITVALECHINTITEDYRTALDFLRDVGEPNLKTYWQPNHKKSVSYNIEAARALASRVVAVHVFNWDAEGRYPLSLAIDTWREYLSAFISEAKLRDIPLLLEFMPDGEISSLDSEADALRAIIRAIDEEG